MKLVSLSMFAAIVFASLPQAWAVGHPDDGSIITAGKQEPPPCNDPRLVKSIRKQYESLDEISGDHLKVKGITDVKQIHFGPVSASVNQYANKSTYGVTSRHCQGSIQLSNGKTDSLFWRVDYLVEGGGQGHSLNYDHCSPKHDLLDPKCQKMRDGK